MVSKKKKGRVSGVILPDARSHPRSFNTRRLCTENESALADKTHCEPGIMQHSAFSHVTKEGKVGGVAGEGGERGDGGG